MIQTPEPLRRAIEKLYMDMTEPLDPYIALALTNLTTKMVDTVYIMGYQDGQRSENTSSCALCESSGECLSRVF